MVISYRKVFCDNITKNKPKNDCMFEIENKFKNANIGRTVRFTQQIFDELNRVAAEEEISFNLLVLQCCQYALDNRGKKGAEEDTKEME